MIACHTRHILTKDAEGEVWIVVLDMGKIHLYPFSHAPHNGHEERHQFETFSPICPGPFLSSVLCFRRARVNLDFPWPTVILMNSILKFFSLAIRAVLIFQVLHSIGATHNHGVAFG